MIIVKHKINNSVYLSLDKSGEIKETVPLTYGIALKDQKEYDNGIELLITKALLNDIDVHEYISNSQRLQYDCDKILSSHDTIVIFETCDESKFETLENMIKHFMTIHKKNSC